MTYARPSRRVLLRFVALLGLLLGPGSALAQDFDIEVPGLDEETPAPPPGGATLFQDVRIFDGRSDRLSEPSNVLVRGDKIERISVEPIEAPDARTIAGQGRTLMPGLIDAHWHAYMAATPQPVLMSADPSYLHFRAAEEAEATLMRGFTTIRDLGGPVFGLKRAIDEGILAGPRIYPSGAFISQTSGHGDFRFLFELPRQPGGPLSHSEREGIAAIADSPDEVRLRTREQLRNGASQIKLMAGGGVSSQHNPIESTQFTEAEIHAAVEAAEDWGTYVTVHAYTPRSVRRAIDAGVKCIDHAQLIDDATAKLMADKGIWWSLQPLTYDADVFAQMSPLSQEKALKVFAGTENAYKLAKKYGIKTAFGSDILFNPVAASRQGRYLAMLSRWMSPAEALTSATANAGELLAMSGFINPYPGKLGVVEQGAFADLILVEGNPLENLDLVSDPEKNFKIIMKDGRIFKDALGR